MQLLTKAKQLLMKAKQYLMKAMCGLLSKYPLDRRYLKQYQSQR
jgi:hypothetical protein